jgi:hypothetical protein
LIEAAPNARKNCFRLRSSIGIIPTILIIGRWRHPPPASILLGIDEGTQDRVCFNPAEVRHQMSKMQTMSRVLVDHNWTNIEEWVCALRDLADLDDEALDEIESLHSRQSNGTAG